VLGNLCCGCNILMHNKFSCGHAVLENNLRENSSLSYLLTKPTKQVFKFVRTKTETCALKLETIRGPSAVSVYMSNLWQSLKMEKSAHPSGADAAAMF
jgi:hypothetical protein